MVNYLNRIIEIDMLAKRKVLEAENKKNNIEEYIEREITKQKNNISAEIQFKLENKKRNIEKDFQTFTDNMDAYLSQKINLIMKTVEVEKEKIINNSFQNIISKKKVK